jgi:hypothetical protein
MIQRGSINPGVVHSMIRTSTILTALLGFFTVGIQEASAGCTSETFDFDDGTMQGWSSFGSYSASNVGDRIHISGSGSGCELQGMQKEFDGGDSLSVYYTWESNATSSGTSNQSFTIRDADTSTGLFGEYVHCGHCGDPGPSASGSYTNTITSEIEGVSNLQVIIGLYDCWSAHNAQTNTIDNVTIEICNEDVDEDGFREDEGDCNDFDASIYPGAPEVCDEIDNDCDGAVDEDDAADAPTWYADGDDDGFGDPATSTEACEQPSGFVGDDTDCNDDSAETWPGATEYCDEIDNDCDGAVDEDDAADASTWYEDSDDDGFGDPATSTEACEQPSGFVGDNTDCNDESSESWPSATEYCDGDDNDCDGVTDEDDAADASTWFRDRDSDGYGDADTSTEACDVPAGYVSDDSDCDDSDDDNNPGAAEYCDGDDNDCDGVTDEDDAVDAPTWYADSDSDGYGDADTTTEACSAPEGHVGDSSDCDDAIGTTFPGAAEACDGIDNDCDGVTDEDDAVDAPTWYIDHDSDGYGSDDYTWVSCDAPDGYIADDTDCDDHLATTNPDADELCDDVDNDCDGAIDEDAVDVLEFFADTDEDGFGDAESAVWACSTPEGHVEDDSDCDDADPMSYPGAPGLTSDCEPIVDDPEDTGDLGDTGDTGEPLDTGDVPTGSDDTGPVDTGPLDTGDASGDDTAHSAPGPDTGVEKFNSHLPDSCSCATGRGGGWAFGLLAFLAVCVRRTD